MLGNEDGVAAHRRLPSVVQRLRGSQALADEVAGMLHDNGEAATVEVSAILRAKPELRPKRRPSKLLEHFIEITHQAPKHKGRRIAPPALPLLDLFQPSGGRP